MFLFRKKKAAPVPKIPNTNTIMKNIVKYTNGNTKALNKYEFENLIGALKNRHSSAGEDYYQNNNGKWVAYHNRGGSLKNMLLEDLRMMGSNSFKN